MSYTEHQKNEDNWHAALQRESLNDTQAAAKTLAVGLVYGLSMIARAIETMR